MDFLYQLFVISILTSLFTEAVKRCFPEKTKEMPNFVAGVIAVLITVVIGAVTIVSGDALWCPQFALYLIILAVFSWACAMLGYDKVKQSILQIVNEKEKDNGSKDRISTDL